MAKEYPKWKNVTSTISGHSPISKCLRKKQEEIPVVLTGSSSIVRPKHSIPVKTQVSKPAIITMF